MNDSSPQTEVTIILPAYNEEQNIGSTVNLIRQLHPEFEILVIDDGSTDNTRTEALQAGALVYSHPYNIGNGAAVKTGLRMASRQWSIMMDSDGQHNPEDISRLLEHKDTFDMVIGARTKTSATSLHRNIANKIYNRLASYVTKFKIEDLTSGFRLVKTDTAKHFLYLLPNTFSYPSTITIAYLRSGRTIKYLPIQTAARQGKSKIKLIEDGIRFLLIITKIATLFSPLRIFLPISALLFLTGLAYYFYTFITIHRFTNMSMLLFTASLIISMMGLISEQVANLHYSRICKD
jgi:glycosyltransferase involved in cell wall biosynthesis